MSEDVKTFRLVKSESIAAPVEVVWETILEELGGGMVDPTGAPVGLKIEPVVGGKWWRDKGNGVGHLWGHVQVIKAPALLEICGPMMMSFAAQNHVQYRLKAEGKGTVMEFVHTAIGLIPDEMAKNMTQGWEMIAKGIREKAEKKGK